MKHLVIIIGYLLFSFAVLAVDYGWIQKEKFPAVGRHRGLALSIADKGYAGLGHMNGTGTNIVYKDWWQYDPATNSWTQKSDYPEPNYAVSYFVIDHKAYVGGGNIGPGLFYVYKAVTNTWTTIPSPPTSPDDETAFSVNGKGYITDNGNFYEFNPATNSWNVKQNCPGTTWSPMSFVVQNKAYYVGSGQTYEYKATLDQWIPRANFPGSTRGGGCAFSLNNKGYIICGFGIGGLSDVNAEFWEFNPATNTWVQKPDFPGTARRFLSAFAINNKGYITLGTNGTNMNDLWEFNPELEFLSLDNFLDCVKVKCYPNPSTDYINIELVNDVDQKAQISIYSSGGQLVRNESLISNQVKIEGLNKGIYFYQITSDDTHSFKGKFIVE